MKRVGKSQEKVPLSEKEVEREMSWRKRCPDKQQATGRSVKMQKCQEQARSRDSGSSGSIKQRCREQEMPKTKNSQDFQEITPSTAPIGSPLSWGWITFKEPDWGMNMHNPS